MENNDQMEQVPNQGTEMNNQVSNDAPTISQSPDPEQKSIGSLVGILIILVIIIIGGWYFLRARSQAVPIFDQQNAENSIKSLETQGTSDEVDSIEADLNATDLSDLDTELDSIDAELNSL